MQRPQKTAEVGCPFEGMLETKSNRGACSIALTEMERKDGAENLLERILERNNLNQAYLKVKKEWRLSRNRRNDSRGNAAIPKRKS